MPEKKLKRPDLLEGQTHKITTNAGNLFLTVNTYKGQPFEVFVRVGKAGGDVMCLCETIGRLLSLALRRGIPGEDIIQQIKGIGGEDHLLPSVPNAIAKVLGS